MVNINGENWRIYLVPSWHPVLIRSNGTTTIGACDDQKKAIYILDGLSIKKFKKVLCHELTHACMFSYDIELSLEQEELLADLVATYGAEIIYKTNSIFKRLKENKNKGTWN